jgi:hypothetical protein
MLILNQWVCCCRCHDTAKFVSHHHGVAFFFFFKKIVFQIKHISTKPPSSVHPSAAHSLILLYCWEIWKHRNEVIFRHMEPSMDRLMATCKEVGRLWSCRIPRQNTVLISRWDAIFNM